MRINFAHYSMPAQNGGRIETAIFDVSVSDTSDRNLNASLNDLTYKARFGLGLQVDQSALVYMYNGRPHYFGDANLVEYLKRNGVPGLNKWMEI